MKNKDTEVELVFNEDGISIYKILEDYIYEYIKKRIEDGIL